MNIHQLIVAHSNMNTESAHMGKLRCRGFCWENVTDLDLYDFNTKAMKTSRSIILDWMDLDLKAGPRGVKYR